MMKSLPFPVFAIVVALSSLVAADEGKAIPNKHIKSAKSNKFNQKPIPVPEELHRFSGMMIGRLVSRDVERGVFVATIDYVPRIWRNNKAIKPRSAVGKTFAVDGVTGKWLDSLLLINPGETIEFEAQHRRGERFTFPGEWLKKTAPFDAQSYPIPPAEFRGFNGVIVGKIESKSQASRECVVRIGAVDPSANNRAKQPKSAIGKRVLVAGFWGRMQKPFDQLNVGDTIHAGLLHRVPQSDHFSVSSVSKTKANPSERSNKPSNKPKEQPSAKSKDSQTGFPAGIRGFRGIMIGVVKSRDVEKGQLVFEAEKVKRVWKRNQAKDLESCHGKVFTVNGISGRFLDVLLVLKSGDRVEVEAFHNRGDTLDFPGELLKKIE